ncbi:unnamed protein product, partial [Prorocentrum cordatum]
TLLVPAARAHAAVGGSRGERPHGGTEVEEEEEEEEAEAPSPPCLLPLSRLDRRRRSWGPAAARAAGQASVASRQAPKSASSSMSASPHRYARTFARRSGLHCAACCTRVAPPPCASISSSSRPIWSNAAMARWQLMGTSHAFWRISGRAKGGDSKGGV